MSSFVNPNSVQPLYRQIADILYGRIESHEWKENERIPSEAMLMDEFAVSRITIRKAISELTDNGILVRSHGRGTFVAPSQAVISGQGDIGFTRSCHLAGKEAKNIVIESGMMMAPVRCMRFFNVDVMEPVVTIRRLRFVDRKATVIENLYYHPKYSKLLSGDLTMSVTELVEHLYGNILGEQKRTVEACVSSDEESKLLNVESGTPMLLIRDQQMDIEGNPMSMSKQIFCTNHLKLYL